MCIIYLYFYGHSDPIISLTYSPFWKNYLILAFVGAYSCCCGDTWASEIGILSKSEPFLITTFKRVPRGTNGGVSLLGLMVSLIGGLFCGLSFYLPMLFVNSNTPQWPILIIGLISGLIGSLIDSLLGATLQYSGYSTSTQKVVNEPAKASTHISGLNILDNHQVNFLSSVITSILIGYFGALLF